MPSSRSAVKILIIYTGGTVGMVYDEKVGALRPIGFKEIKDNIPEIVKLGYDFHVHAFNPPMDSSNISPRYGLNWRKSLRGIIPCTMAL